MAYDENYGDLLFEDFNLRRSLIRLAHGDRPVKEEKEVIVRLSAGDPGQLPKPDLIFGPECPTIQVQEQCYYGVPGRTASDGGGRKTVADLIADTPNTVLRS